MESGDQVEPPVWLNDFNYDICLIHSDKNSFADVLTAYLKDIAIRCYRHYPSALAAHRQDYEDINDEEHIDPARSLIEDALKTSKFFMFIFSHDFMDTASQFHHDNSEGVVLHHFAPDDPVHTSIELPNLLPILDGTEQDQLKQYSKAMGSKIPINTAIGAKRLSEMFFKKLTGQMPAANFKLQDYLKKKKHSN
ncbi:uncharacterized protein LOC134189043 [Corticium candelabrum]|uniref:uncharacterized protein LOC134189043 n=1 Tax=Corticium candelabrum TaxID=121492 RepID=UPI002E256EB3|nr:uncharacterized protein LOC134189043 [Corticium candelabrum]